MKKALFLDRDGVINVDFGYVYQIDNFEWQEGIFDLCSKAIEKGYLIIIITNQSGIARGYYTEKDLSKLHNWMTQEFQANNIHITEIYYCPHHPEIDQEMCNCRKPASGMFEKAIQDYNIDVSQSIMIGDKETDLIPAKKLNITKRFQLNNDQKLYDPSILKIKFLHEVIDFL
ncbi:D-glycero-alpha-D-manno-heptose-1,7-bisphosphate 7-phosphatase [Rickettsiales endosymbiont of Stachyamoeba lipophora]|uniref:D-glycero-alpha-D-manno-heptose-1,7-bisphosphate 7-phosphatase n=1 Tax=Rickettsiales endosymbiont of Stachyamoeba lipophora TaxID=2486578 RepID=UPI000F64A686|nr:HAD family hydrolase [Rickettsiales endosymbiont of Stachyamoeba lipophora]AZL15672.1 HAD family hydrolase [Rickettsiales endosymbiont of Stachyamoeba lipophora]